MRFIIRLFTVACCAVVAFSAGPADAEKRLGLSVGIDVYDELPALEQLQRAVNDAQAMAGALTQLGFETALEKNIPRLGFMRAWQAFLNRLKPGDIAAVFFAGHGVEINGLNYLLPRDVPKVMPGEDQVLAAASIRFNDLMDSLRDRKVRVALFIVDACRDNPFRDGSGRSVGGTRGLARVEAAEGSFVMYSAGAGQQALDRLPGGADTSPNSVYTRTLLPILKMPGLSLRDIAGRVQDEVLEVTGSAGRKQTPAYYDQAAGKFVLKPGVKPPPVPVPLVSAADRMWLAVKDTTSVPALEAFRQRYGKENPIYDTLAEARIEGLKRKQVTKQPQSGLGYVAVVASKKTPLEALEVYANLAQQYPGILADTVLDVQESDQTSRGLGFFYRAIVGPPRSRGKAVELCGQLKTAGFGNCWVKEY